jgi:hypothetical protein
MATSPLVLEIPTTNQPQSISISLAGVTYNLLIRWNDANQSWVIDISDVNNNPIATGLAMVTADDLLEQLGYLNFGGKLISQTDNDPSAPPTFFNLGSTGHLYFLPEASS